jgi:DNA-binding PadR family transcriptional regulator
MPTATSFLPLKSDILLILLALASRPMHGYAVIQDVAERSDGEVELQTGALYRTLRRLMDYGLIQECPRPASAVGDDERRRYYRVTALGQSVITAEVQRMETLVRAARLTADGKRPRLA